MACERRPMFQQFNCSRRNQMRESESDNLDSPCSRARLGRSGLRTFHERSSGKDLNSATKLTKQVTKLRAKSSVGSVAPASIKNENQRQRDACPTQLLIAQSAGFERLCAMFMSRKNSVQRNSPAVMISASGRSRTASARRWQMQARRFRLISPAITAFPAVARRADLFAQRLPSRFHCSRKTALSRHPAVH